MIVALMAHTPVLAVVVAVELSKEGEVVLSVGLALVVDVAAVDFEFLTVAAAVNKPSSIVVNWVTD